MIKDPGPGGFDVGTQNDPLTKSKKRTKEKTRTGKETDEKPRNAECAGKGDTKGKRAMQLPVVIYDTQN